MRMYSPLFLAVATFSGAAVTAQADERAAQERQAPAVRTPDYAFLDDVLGAKVSIQPGAAARREAAEEKEKAKRPSGEIKDLILEGKTGKFEGAVVAFGGLLGIGDKTVALPMTLLNWNAANKCFDLSADEDQLKALPAFDLKEARKRGLDNEIVVVRTTWTKLEPVDAAAKKAKEEVTAKKDDVTGKKEGETAEAAHKPQEPVKANVVAGTTYVIVPTRFVVASEVDDYPVYATGEKFGKITKCIVDRNARELEFCVVSHGGALGVGDTEYLVPHHAMTLCRDGDNQIYCISRTAEQLKAGVKYEKPKHGGVVDLEAAKRAESMF